MIYDQIQWCFVKKSTKCADRKSGYSFKKSIEKAMSRSVRSQLLRPRNSTPPHLGAIGQPRQTTSLCNPLFKPKVLDRLVRVRNSPWLPRLVQVPHTCCCCRCGAARYSNILTLVASAGSGASHLLLLQVGGSQVLSLLLMGLCHEIFNFLETYYDKYVLFVQELIFVTIFCLKNQLKILARPFEITY